MDGISNLLQEISNHLHWLPVFCFLQRLSLTWKQGTAFDSWGHIFFVNSVRKNKSGPFGAIYPKVVNGGSFYYPLFSHWLYSFLPAGLLIRFSHVLNPALDALFLFTSILLMRSGDIPTASIVGCALLYIFTPLCFSKISIGPRVANFTTRMVSEMLLPLLFLIWFLDLEMLPIVRVLACTMLGAVILMSSKFGVQALTFTVLISSLLTADWALAVTFILAILVALVLSRGAFLKNLKEQIDHLSWYFRSVSEGKLFVANRNSLNLLWAWNRKDRLSQNLQNLIFNWTAKNSLTLLLLKAPAFLLAAIALVTQVTNGSISTIDGLEIVMISAFVIYLATSFKYLLFLGEAERYLTHVAIIICLILAQFWDFSTPQYEWLMMLLILHGVVYWVVELFAFVTLQPFGTQDHESILVTKLNGLPDERTILSYPYHVLPPYRVMVETEHRTFFPILASMEQKKELEPFEDYPFPDLSRSEELYERFGVDCLIIAKKDLDERIPQWTPGAVGWESITLDDHAQVLMYLRKPTSL